METLGIDYLDGVLNPGDSISAHPHGVTSPLKP
ncbi:similar to Lignostilbene-alpha beta-dioxygenase and related enzymes [Crocosphaera watsonii WH 0401]|uniref:Similar to Lignostilbene-alpha beta-dioxygenase and related enzymes n=1 Tax=Crocosphaera watsonii WH 0401 TaxID=555881 RepID=T2J519_CROWT|nr:similar to Lignostilbene-alpha beta-dioxygenase and related enzymes [Crocosphaera watsonii WH 0401]